MTADIAQLIDRYVRSLMEHGAIRTPAVESAFRRVQRHQFIERVYKGDGGQWDPLAIDPANPEHLALVYSDRALVTHLAPDSAGPLPSSSSSQPALMADMLELMALRPGMRVLEIGAGTGYNAALLAEIVGDPERVTTIDIQEEVAAECRRHLAAAGYGEIHVLRQEGLYGDPAQAPFDRIVATVGCPDLSPHWLEQLAPDGSMLIPLAHGSSVSCPLMRVEKDGNRVRGRVVGYSGFMSAQGEFSLDVWAPATEGLQALRPVLPGLKPDTAYPPFDGLKELPSSTCRGCMGWAARMEFLYFLALCSRQTFACGPMGIGLLAEDGIVLLCEEGIQLFGPQAPGLYQEVEEAYHSWEALGRPLMTHYETEFVPLSEASRPEPSPRTWTIDRKFFRQVVRLRENVAVGGG